MRCAIEPLCRFHLLGMRTRVDWYSPVTSSARLLSANYISRSTAHRGSSTLPPCNGRQGPSHASFHSASNTSRGTRLRRVVPFGVAAHLFDLYAQFLVLAHFDDQILHGESGLLLQTARCQQIHVGGLVVAVLEVGGLDPALAHERL